MARPTRTLALVMALSLAAACTDETGAGTSASTATTDASDGPEVTVDADAPLTASFTGVTADAIAIGYTQIDFDQLRDEFSIDLNFQNGEQVLEALVDDLNERGGINGRRVDATVRTYVPIGAASAEELCIRFTEDEPVFAVLGGFGGLASDVNSCIADRHATALIGGTWTEAQHAEAEAPWLRADMTLARRSVGFAEALGDGGHLDDHDRIAIVSSTAANEPFLGDVEAALRAGGSEVVLNATVSAAGGADEVRTLLERAQSSGATAVFYSGLNPALYPAMADFDFQYFFEDATTTEASLRDFLRGGGQLDILSNGPYPYPYRDDAEMAECIDIVEERTDIVVEDPNTLADDQPNWWEAVSRACQNLRLFELVAVAAGPVLTNDSFRDAAEQVGSISLPGIASGSLAPGKYDAADVSSMVEWDPTLFDGDGGWVPVGDPYDVP